MDDLLKEAIADAKAVRETALENAKIALEEAFTPRLQSMLSQKIQSDMEDVTEEEMDDEEDMEEGREDKDDDMEEGRKDKDDDMDEGAHEDDEDMEEEGRKSMMNADDEDPTDDHSEGVIEIDGVKYAPVVAEEEEEEDDMEEGREDKDDDMDEDLDLEAVLKELEADINEEDEEDEMEEGRKDKDDDMDETVDENDVSSGIGKSDNAHDKKSGDSTDIGKAGKAKFESVEEATEEVEESKEETTEDVEEDIDLEEIIKTLSEEEENEKTTDEVAKLQSELSEHRDVVKYLRSKLNEVNLLNAKLLFTNKLFRAYGLSNDQKMKVVENFDRATNLREVKLVYSTLAESFGTTKKTEIKESKGSASKATPSTKSEKQEEILTEGDQMRARFKKLAGII